MLWDDDADEPGTAHGYNYDDDDERELMQRTCDCIVEHKAGHVCQCVCHPPALVAFKVGDPAQPWALRLVCGSCYVSLHQACNGRRANKESCECKRCGDDAENGA